MVKIKVDFLGYSISGARTIVKGLKASYRYDVYKTDCGILLHIQDYPEQFPYLVRLEPRKWQAVLECFEEPE